MSATKTKPSETVSKLSSTRMPRVFYYDM